MLLILLPMYYLITYKNIVDHILYVVPVITTKDTIRYWLLSAKPLSNHCCVDWIFFLLLLCQLNIGYKPDPNLIMPELDFDINFWVLLK